MANVTGSGSSGNPHDSIPNPALAPAHEKYLLDRGVPLELAVKSGLWSATADELAPHLGYMPRGDGLAMPYPGVEPPYVRVRLDTDELEPGAPRFLSPKDAEVPVYVPPGLRADAPLLITEGPIKALSLVADGFAAVGLGGVDTTLTADGKLNKSWEAVAVSGRDISIVFDSNRTKPQIARAEARLAYALGEAGAHVCILKIPAGKTGDWGPDDLKVARGPAAIAACSFGASPADPIVYAREYLAAHGPDAISDLLEDATWLISLLVWPRSRRQQVKAIYKKHKLVRELDAAIADAKAALNAAARNAAGPSEAMYSMASGRTVLSTDKAEVVLARFEARLTREVVVDDGVEQTRRFELEGITENGDSLPPIPVDAETFARGNWPLERWGARAVVSAGVGARDHLRAAIQLLSSPDTTTVYRHTGWRRAPDGTWMFLHAGGAIGADDAHVELDGDLARYELPPPGGPAQDGYQRALELLDIAPDRITVPLLLAAFRAPLMVLLPMDAVVHLFGTTGSLKSSLAALFISFFGKFDHATLPGSFIDTFGTLERKCNVLHDVLLVVDEYVPSSGDNADEMRRTATRFLRYVGNRSPRGRLRADLTARPGRPPNALVVTTGEDIPTGESVVARTLSVEMRRGDVNLQRLTAAQAAAAQLPHVMAAYIVWLQERMDLLESRLPGEFSRYRAALSAGAAHRRTPSTGAQLLLAAELIAELGVDLHALDVQDARALVDRLHRGAAQAVDAQRSAAATVNPGERFLEVLRELLSARRCRIVRPGAASDDHVPVVGYAQGAKVHLLKDVVMREVMELVHRQGGRLAASANEILRSLRDQALMTAGDGAHLLPQRVVDGKKLRVIEIDASLLDGTAAPGSQHTAQPPLAHVIPLTADAHGKGR